MTTKTALQLNDVDLQAVGALVTTVAEDPEQGQTEWEATVNWAPSVPRS